MKKTICFLFHMHQPFYLNLETGSFEMPWVRLHALKGYTDIPAIASRFPDIRFTVNMVPSLTAQLEAYQQGKATDRWLVLSRKAVFQLTEEERLFIVENFFSVNRKVHMKPATRYRELLMKRSSTSSPEALKRRLPLFNDRDIQDLQALFNLSWFGFTAFHEYPELKEMRQKGRSFTRDEIERILDIQEEVLAMVLPRCRRQMEDGNVEFSISPYYHPILPLLVNTDNARRCMPDSKLPPSFSAPADAAYQIDAAVRAGTALFGTAPTGMWPSEGAVSPEVLDMMAASGIRWAATDEEILKKSGFETRHRHSYLYHPYQFETVSGPLTCLFRDRVLSDMMGFSLYDMTPDAAVQQFLSELDTIDAYHGDNKEELLIPVILDGENPWENYEESGEPFLVHLFEALAGRKDLSVDSISNALARIPAKSAPGPIHSGSWINSNYKIWIGHRETNTAWTYLARVRRFLVERTGLSAAPEKESIDPSVRAAWASLMIAEGSDWFWWYGDDFESHDQDRFDRLFLEHLANVYRKLGESVPQFLSAPIRATTFRGRLTLPGRAIHPDITGKPDGFFQWRNAGIFLNSTRGSAMFTGDSPVRRILFGQDEEFLFIRLVFAADFQAVAGKVVFLDSIGYQVTAKPGVEDVLIEQTLDSGECRSTGELARAALAETLDVRFPAKILKLTPGETVHLSASVQGQGDKWVNVPDFGTIDTGMVYPFDRASFWTV
ncbi:MAG: glycoside hydrolase [Holophagae bacterium]|nr:glycoside hydrolase [Holophagae bacterium]